MLEVPLSCNPAECFAGELRAIYISDWNAWDAAPCKVGSQFVDDISRSQRVKPVGFPEVSAVVLCSVVDFSICCCKSCAIICSVMLSTASSVVALMDPGSAVLVSVLGASGVLESPIQGGSLSEVCIRKVLRGRDVSYSSMRIPASSDIGAEILGFGASSSWLVTAVALARATVTLCAAKATPDRPFKLSSSPCQSQVVAQKHTCEFKELIQGSA